MALIAHYKLNGDLKDSVGNNHGVPTTSATPSFSDGVIGLCGEFNVSPIGSDVGWNINKEFSYSFWAIRDGSDGSSIGGLVGNHYHSTGPTGVNIYFANNNTQIRYAAGDGIDRSNQSVNTPTPTNVWNHYVLSYDGKTLRLYQNGEMIHQWNRTVKQDASRGWAIGRWAASYTSYNLVGRIDDVRIYDHCLSKKEIINLNQCKIQNYPLKTDRDNSLGAGSLSGGEFSDDNNKPFLTGRPILTKTTAPLKLKNETISFFMKCDVDRTTVGGGSFNNWIVQFGAYNGNNSGGIGIQSGGLSGFFKGATNSGWTTSGSFSSFNSLYDENKFIHYTVVFGTDNIVKIFMNGQFARNYNMTSDPFTDMGGNIVFGRNMDASMYGLEIFKREFSDDEVFSLYSTKASIDDKGNFHAKSITESKSIGFQETPIGGSHNSYGMRFTVSKDTVIKSAKMRPYFTGNATVQLWDFDNQNSPLQEVEIEVTSGKIDLFDLNLFCQTGINYWLTVTGGNFMRTDAGIVFPRTHGTFTFTLPSNSDGSTADRWYYFFDVRYAELKSVERFQTSMGKISEKGLVDGLVAWYPLINDTDDYINRNDGVNNGAVAVSDGYEFKTTNDRIVTKDIREIVGNSTSSITFSAWISMTAIDNDINMFMGQTLPYFGFRSSRHIYFSTDIEGVQRSLTSSSQYDLGEWYLATFTFDNGTMRIYVNGVIDGENTNYEGNMTFRSGQFSFGDGRSSNWYPFIGKLRDVRVYDRALNSNEVARLYNTTKPDGSAVSLASDGIFIKNQIKEV